MSVTRALAELKLLGSRIASKVEQAKFAAVQVGDKPLSGYSSTEDFLKQAVASYDSIVTLIHRRNAIKSAIVISNASTQVQIGGQVLTVAEAIERKSSIQHQRELLSKLVKEHDEGTREVNKLNEKVQERLDKLVEASLGSDVKVKDDQYESIATPFLKKNEAKLVDPLNIREKTEKLLADIVEFESEVDFVLSTSNATTMIEVKE